MKYLQPLANNEYMIDDTQKFADIIKENKRKDNEEDVSYDIVSLFTSIPIKETNYICDEIYVNKKLEPFCKKRLIFQNLLHRLAIICDFQLTVTCINKRMDAQWEV